MHAGHGTTRMEMSHRSNASHHGSHQSLPTNSEIPTRIITQRKKAQIRPMHPMWGPRRISLPLPAHLRASPRNKRQKVVPDKILEEFHYIPSSQVDLVKILLDSSHLTWIPIEERRNLKSLTRYHCFNLHNERTITIGSGLQYVAAKKTTIR